MTAPRPPESRTFDADRDAKVRAALDRADLRVMAILGEGHPAPLEDALLEGAQEMKRAAEVNAKVLFGAPPR